MERVMRPFVCREPSGGEKTVYDRARKTLRSLRKKPKREVEPHGTPRYGEMKRAAYAVNLGGIAEDVFRPMFGRMASFLFLKGHVHR